MPQIKSQIKRMKTNEERRQKNRSVKSEIHTKITKFKTAAEAGDKDAANDTYMKAVKSLDKAASKGIIHKNKAANKKSKLRKRLNQVNA